MFKKKGLQIGDLLRSIKTESKEVKKGNAISDVLTMKSNEAPGKESTTSNKGSSDVTEKLSSLDELMGNLLIKKQVKFAEGQTLRSPLGEELKRAFKGEKVSKGATKYNPQWTEEGKKTAEKIFSCNWKQYFLTLHQLSQHKK